MDNNLVFRVQVHEGMGFGAELQALTCLVTLGDSTRHTAFSIGRDKHSFVDTPLQWSTSKQQWRKLSSAGQFFCKVVVARKANGAAPLQGSPDKDKDLQRLGWVVLDLRQAKLNAQHKDKALEGEHEQLRLP